MTFFSIIIPVYNGADHLPICLNSVQSSTFTDWELIVVDDASTDASAAIAEEWGAQVLQINGRSGPAAARNIGAERANGRYLFFTDSDCQLHSDALQQAADILQVSPQLDALIGSYDNAPAAANFLSQVKNLHHHYIHQTSQSAAQTFWTGCGAIKRKRFYQLGGFNATRYPRPSIEDIELGYRLIAQGGKIRLAAAVQVKHLKRWHWLSLLRSDIFARAIPWTQLLREQKIITADLNLQWLHRLSALLVLLLIMSLVVLPRFPRIRPLIPLCLANLLLLNRQLYQFFHRQQGSLFTLQAILWHWFYYLYSLLAFIFSYLNHSSKQR